jgi:hypothetical protein
MEQQKVVVFLRERKQGAGQALEDDFRTLLMMPIGPESIFQHFTA